MLKTKLCATLGIDYPIFSVGMGLNISGPELSAAVSNAGGCGVLGSGDLTAPAMRAQIKALRELTDKPFGVNIIMPMMQEGQVEVALEQKVPFIVFFWGDPSPYIADCRKAGVKVFIQVGTVEEAVAAAKMGVDAIIAQGIEAGGHVKSKTSLSTIVPAVVELVAPIPVLAAGGIATGRGVVAALSLGAQGVSLGTRFLATTEARVTAEYKQRIVDARAEDTVYTSLFNLGWDNAAHRVLRNRDYNEWEAAGSPSPGRRPGEGSNIAQFESAQGEVIDVPKYSVMPPVTGYRGDHEHAALYAGESVRLIHDIKPAAEVVRDLVREAEAVLAELCA